MAEPTFRIEYQRNGDTLRARFSGDNSALDTLVACWMALAEELRRDPPAALLVVDEMQGAAPDPDELAQFVQSMVGLGFEGVRVAYVEAYALQVPKVAQFQPTPPESVRNLPSDDKGILARTLYDDKSPPKPEPVFRPSLSRVRPVAPPRAPAIRGGAIGRGNMPGSAPAAPPSPSDSEN